MTRLSFSLRGLLMLTVPLAAFCWYRDLPRQNANRFVDAYNTGQWRKVQAMLDHQLFFDAHDGNYQHKASGRPQSFADWICGQCVVEVQCSAPGRVSAITFLVTAGRIQIKSIVSDASGPVQPRSATRETAVIDGQ